MATKKTAIESIGELIRRERRERGYTTTTLAKKLKLSQAQVSRIETGRQGLRWSVLTRVMKVLGVSEARLLHAMEGLLAG